MKIGQDIKAIRELLDLSQEELGYKLAVSQKDIARWEKDHIEPGDNYIDKIFEFAVTNNIDLNNAYEMALKNLYEKGKDVVLFHGPKERIDFPLSLKHSKINNDFGVGFYMGEKYEQASQYIRAANGKKVYSFVLNTQGLKIVKFGITKEWMLAIAYYRGRLDEYKESKTLKRIIEKVEKADLIIAPIADNKMYNTINQFIYGEINDEQCKHALACSGLGNQYVVKNNKTLKKVKLLKEFYVCNYERNILEKNRKKYNEKWLEESKEERIKYRNKGKYIEEILND